MATYLYCRNCGTANVDPGGDERGYRCGHCHGGPLVRLETRPPPERPAGGAAGALAVGTVGVALGGALGGPAGALVGGAVGALIGAFVRTGGQRQ